MNINTQETDEEILLPEEFFEVTMKIDLKIGLELKSKKNSEEIIAVMTGNNSKPEFPVYVIHSTELDDGACTLEILEGKNNRHLGLGILLGPGRCIGDYTGFEKIIKVDEKEWKRAIKCGVSPTII